VGFLLGQLPENGQQSIAGAEDLIVLHTGRLCGNGALAFSC
jgi:hypothetical protein